jgi:hypothetical protein
MLSAYFSFILVAFLVQSASVLLHTHLSHPECLLYYQCPLNNMFISSICYNRKPPTSTLSNVRSLARIVRVDVVLYVSRICLFAHSTAAYAVLFTTYMRASVHNAGIDAATLESRESVILSGLCSYYMLFSNSSNYVSSTSSRLVPLSTRKRPPALL